MERKRHLEQAKQDKMRNAIRLLVNAYESTRHMKTVILPMIETIQSSEFAALQIHGNSLVDHAIKRSQH